MARKGPEESFLCAVPMGDKDSILQKVTDPGVERE
jgi:hypothetical protein